MDSSVKGQWPFRLWRYTFTIINVENAHKEMNHITCTKEKSKPDALWNVSQHPKFLRRAVNTSLNRQAGRPSLLWCPPLFIQYIRCCRPSSVRNLRTPHAVVVGKILSKITKEKDHWIRKKKSSKNVLDKHRRTVRYSRIYFRKFPASGASNVNRLRMTSQIGRGREVACA